MAVKNEDEEDATRLDRLNKIYLTIISRYKYYIEEKENLSAVELPTRVTPQNLAVQEKVNEIKAAFEPYSYENNFYEASVRAFSFVKDNTDSVVLSIQFWLTPEETLALRMGDIFDRNILLCSLLVGLGNPSSKVFVTIKEETRKMFVYYEFEDTIYMLNLEDNIQKFKNKELMIESLNIDDDTAVYEFNDRAYVDVK
jgi:hypothetical protein